MIQKLTNNATFISALGLFRNVWETNGVWWECKFGTPAQPYAAPQPTVRKSSLSSTLSTHVLLLVSQTILNDKSLVVSPAYGTDLCRVNNLILSVLLAQSFCHVEPKNTPSCNHRNIKTVQMWLHFAHCSFPTLNALSVTKNGSFSKHKADLTVEILMMVHRLYEIDQCHNWPLFQRIKRCQTTQSQTWLHPQKY